MRTAVVVTFALLTGAVCQAQDKPKPEKPKPTQPKAEPAKPPAVKGFTYLRRETFSCGGQTHAVHVYRNERFAEALGLAKGKTDVAAEFVLVPGGTFMMGSPKSEKGRSSAEGPQHQVHLKPFLLARTEVTQRVWERVMGKNPSHFKFKRAPVEQVSWDDAQEFCKKTGLRLPSEAEWEYACRAGTTTPFAFGQTITADQVNYAGNKPYGDAPEGIYREQTTDVASLPPNAFGLYDVHGNVWEWCQDTYQSSYAGAPANGSAWEEAGASFRVRRGGCWVLGARRCRSAGRNGYRPVFRRINLGFRPAATLP